MCCRRKKQQTSGHCQGDVHPCMPIPVLRQDVASYETSVEKAELEAKRKRVADAELKWLQVRFEQSA